MNKKIMPSHMVDGKFIGVSPMIGPKYPIMYLRLMADGELTQKRMAEVYNLKEVSVSTEPSPLNH